jgi:membrane-bound metal-dependent hydrolase YbcI (DUF457 family)
VAIWAIQQTKVFAKDYEVILLGALVSMLGSVAVDIDHPEAFISRGFPKEILKRSLLLLLIPLMLAAMPGGSKANFVVKLRSYQGWIQIGLIGIAFFVGLRILSRVVFSTLGHRGPLHSLFFTVLASVVAVVAISIAFDGSKWWLGLCFGWGWLSHVLTDKWLTPQGVPLWWPISD